MRKWPQSYLETHLENLIKMYVESRPGNMRLAQAAFRDGAASFLILFVLLRESEGQIEAVYCVPRTSHPFLTSLELTVLSSLPMKNVKLSEFRSSEPWSSNRRKSAL